MKKSSKSKRIENIDPELDTLAKELQDIARKALAEYTPIVDSIVNSKSRDTRHIEQALDGLLGFCFDAQALQLYKKLCRYYYPIDKAAAAYYVNAYLEMYEPEQGKGV